MVKVELTDDQANSLRIVARDRVERAQGATDARARRMHGETDADIDSARQTRDYWQGILTALGDVPTY
jgi:hypothetical protein